MPVWIDDSVTITHNKLIIIHRRLVIGGCFNYMVGADTENAGNVTFIDAIEVVAGWSAIRVHQLQAGRRFEAFERAVFILWGLCSSMIYGVVAHQNERVLLPFGETAH